MRLFWIVGLIGVLAIDEDEGVLLDEEEDSPPPVAAPYDEPPVPVTYSHAKWKFTTPSAANTRSPTVLVAETFQEDVLTSSKAWTTLLNPQYQSSTWKHTDVHEDLLGEKGMAMTDGMKYYGMAKKLSSSWDNSSPALYGSMEAMFKKNHSCGGGYFKLFDSSALEGIDHFDGSTSYSIMFGPDHCGFGNSRVHLIIQRTEKPENEAGNEIREEFHFDKVDLPEGWRDYPHQYGFGLTADGHYKIYIDGEVAKEGEMVDGFVGGFKSKEMIDDPEDQQPEDWTPGDPEIPDPTATKPEDWDESQPEMIEDHETPMPEGWEENEPLHVPNPDAQKPEDWIEEEDGEWLRPMMKNPKCAVGCGPWKPMKKNPLYKGPWAPPMIPNPDYKPRYMPRQIKNPIFYDYSDAPFRTIEKFDAVGFELWTVEGGTTIDNVFVGTSAAEFETWLQETYRPKKMIAEENKQRKKTAMTENAEAPKERTLASYGVFLVPLLCIGGYILRKVMKSSKKRDDEASATKKSDDKPATEGEKPATEGKTPEEEKETEAEERKAPEATGTEETKARKRKETAAKDE